jgi:predicted transcriptional regulator
MTPAELRNHNFATLRDSLAERRRDVYRAFCDHGPATTFELSEKCGIGLLSVRPRACELAELGLLCKAGERTENGKKATVYAVTDAETWTEWRDENFPADGQLQMGLNQSGALTT